MKNQRKRRQPQRKNAQLLDDAKQKLAQAALPPGFLHYMRDKLKKENKKNAN